MHIDHPVESFEEDVLDLDLLADAGIVDEDVDLAQRRFRLGVKRARRRGVADIAVIGKAVLAELLHIRHHACGSGWVIDMAKRNISSLLGKGTGNRRTDAPTGAGDKSLLAGKLWRSGHHDRATFLRQTNENLDSQITCQRDWPCRC